MTIRFRTLGRLVPLALTLAVTTAPSAQAVEATPASAPTIQILPLRYARPWDLLKIMHWDGAPDAHPAMPLPAGVRKIESVPDQNALRIEGTADGLAKVQDIVQDIDIAPRYVQVKLQFVRATVSDVDAFGINSDLLPSIGETGPGHDRDPKFLPVASGPIVATLLDKLTQGQPASSTTLVTSNNVPASASLHLMFPSLPGATSGGGRFAIDADAGVTVVPRVNSDDTLTLSLAPTVSVDSPVAPKTPVFRTLRTVKDGETMVVGGFGVDGQTELLLFVTPALLPKK